MSAGSSKKNKTKQKNNGGEASLRLIRPIIPILQQQKNKTILPFRPNRSDGLKKVYNV